MWTPLPQGVAEVQRMLLQAVEPKASTASLREARTRLEQISASNPEFIKYLAYTFTNPFSDASGASRELDVAARALSGLLLKNTLQANWQSMSPETLGYIMDSVLPCLQNPNKLIRSTAGHVLAKIIAKTRILQNGSNILEQLKQCVRQEENDFLCDGASLALLYIAEDGSNILDSDETGRPINHLMPFWIEQLNHLKPLLRERALDCIEIFFPTQPLALTSNSDIFLRALSGLQNDPSPRVRRKVLRALCSILQYMPDRVSNDLFISMAQFALKAMEDEEDEVAREGCEFFDVALGEIQFIPCLSPLLPNLVPLLIRRMAYSSEELFDLEDEIKPNSHIPDQPQDWKPNFHNSGGDWHARLLTSPSSRENVEDEEDDDIDGEQPYWTTRRTASLVLDTLSSKVGHQELGSVFIPIVSARLQSSQWVERESAILALGAVADGSLISQIGPHLPAILPYLISQVNDQSTLIRRIALWAISRYATYVVDSPQDLSSSLEVILSRFQDTNKSVQGAAVGALAEIFQAAEGKPVLIHFLQPIVIQMTEALDRFQVNNIYHLFDAFTALFKYAPVNEYLSNPNLMNIYMPRIWAKFNNAAPGDPNLPAMTWFLAQACATLGSSFLPFAELAIVRCRDIMDESLSVAEAAIQCGEPLGFGDFEHLSCTLELMSSLVTGLKGSFIQSPNAKLSAQLVFKCASYLPDYDVIEVAVGVLGDLCMFCPEILRGSEADLFSLFIRIGEDIDSARIQSGACRNAVWACSELARVCPQLLQQNPRVIEEGVLMSGALMLFREDNIEWAHDTADVAAVLASELCLISPEVFQNAFNRIGQNNGDPRQALQSWTKILFRMNEQIPSRQRAVEGWVTFIMRRSDLIANIIPLVLCTIASMDFRSENPSLHQLLVTLANNIKSSADRSQWMQKLSPLSEDLRTRLRDIYNCA